MKTITTLAISFVMSFIYSASFAQDEIHTIFKGGVKSNGGYAAISNKFSTIGGEFANIQEIYGGWYINKKFLLGVGGSASTNYIPVPVEYSESPTDRMSYLYGQAGLVNEYVIGSNKAIHFVFHLFNGAGYTLQYDRALANYDNDFDHDYPKDMNWFFVTEPGVQVELNLLKWMRLSPGVTYRLAYGSDANGLTDSDISGASFNFTLKFGKF